MSFERDINYLIFSIITNWIWLHQPARLNALKEIPRIPSLIQFDGDTKLGGKLEKMRKSGFYFLQENKISCDDTLVEVCFKSK